MSRGRSSSAELKQGVEPQLNPELPTDQALSITVNLLLVPSLPLAMVPNRLLSLRDGSNSMGFGGLRLTPTRRGYRNLVIGCLHKL